MIKERSPRIQSRKDLAGSINKADADVPPVTRWRGLHGCAGGDGRDGDGGGDPRGFVEWQGCELHGSGGVKREGDGTFMKGRIMNEPEPAQREHPSQRQRALVVSSYWTFYISPN